MSDASSEQISAFQLLCITTLIQLKSLFAIFLTYSSTPQELGVNNSGKTIMHVPAVLQSDKYVSIKHINRNVLLAPQMAIIELGIMMYNYTHFVILDPSCHLLILGSNI